MKLLSSAIFVFVVLAFVACAPPPAEEVVVEEPDTTEADIEAIRQVDDRMVEATNSGDIEAWLAVYTEDTVVMPPNEPVVVGRDAVRAWAQQMFDQLDMEDTVSIQEIQVAGDWAFMRATYNFRTTPKAGGESMEVTGKYLAIFSRQPDGSWRLARLVWNTDNPPPQQ